MIFTFIVQEFLFTTFYKSLSLYGIDIGAEQFYAVSFGILSAHFVFKFVQSSFMSYFILATNKNLTREIVTGVAKARPVVLDDIPQG